MYNKVHIFFLKNKNYTNLLFSYIVIFILCLSKNPVFAQSQIEIHTAKKIYVADSQMSTIESFAIHGGSIIFTGSINNAKTKYKNAKIIHHKGILYPGFIDAHCHFLAYCRGTKELNTFGIDNPAKIAKMAKKFARKTKRTWIVGRGWDQNLWKSNEFPSKEILDKTVPKRPVCLSRVDGHAVWVNSKAIETLKLNLDTMISGGEIVKDKFGKPTGIFIDNAADWITSQIPKLDEETMNEAVKKGLKQVYSNGLTTIDEAGLEYSDIEYINKLQTSGKMNLRVYAMMRYNLENIEKLLMSPNNPYYENTMLNVRSMKFYLDGALGSRGALLKNDYCDRLGHHGLQLLNMNEFELWCTQLRQKNYQVCVHAIGDSANSLVIKSFKKLIPYDQNLRWRIEHAQIVSPKDMKVLSERSIIPSIQPTHATSDAPWALSRLCIDTAQSKRNKNINNPMTGAYAYKNLIKYSKILALGTDFPVENISTLATFYAATQRKDIEGQLKTSFIPSQALSRKETLLGMTLWAAYANFEESLKGSLQVGKFADFIEMNTDILEAEPNILQKAKILKTYINGQLVWEM